MSATLEHARQQLLGLLDETWKGSAAAGLPGGWSYYSDSDSGLEQSLSGLSAQFAGRLIGRTSIAQQVQHTAFGAGIFAAWLRGEETDADWAGSFVTGELDESSWSQLREALWSALAGLRRDIVAHALDSNERLTTACGAVAHAVYHLGSIRAKLTAL